MRKTEIHAWIGILSVLCTSAPVFAQDKATVLQGISLSADGTGVGNGGEGNRAGYIEKLKAELSSGNRFVPQSELDGLYEWCSRVTRMLKREKKRAMLHLQSERLEVAEQVLKDALVVASQSLQLNHSLGNPLTKRMIDRGVIYADGIENALDTGAPRSRMDLLTLIHFISGFVDLIVATEERLDRPYYLPFHYRYGRCEARCPDEFDVAAFTERYLQAGKDELSFLVRNSVTQERVEGRWVVSPIGRPEAFLKLAEVGSGFIAEEISQTLYAYRFSCGIADLRNLSEILRDFNLFQDRSVFPNVRYAVAESAREIERIVAGMSCGLNR